MTGPAVVFDLDGTLVDSAPAIHAAVTRLLAAEERPPLAPGVVRAFIGNGVPALITKVMQAAALPAGGDEHTRLVAAFLADYEADPIARTVPMPGAPEALRALAAEGCRLALCTNKPEGPTRAILAAFGLLDLFGAVIGGDTLPRRKPDPAPLRAAFRGLGAASGLYVGDGEVDAATALAAGVPLLLYTGGYRCTAVKALPHAGAFHCWADLPALVLGRAWQAA